MNRFANCLASRTAVLLGFALTMATAGIAEDSAEVGDEKALIGRWDLTIKDSRNNEFPSWLELSAKQGEWKARFVGRWGHARFLPVVTIERDTIHFVSPREEEGSKTDLIFDGKLKGQELTGTAKGPDGTVWEWSGKRAPALDPVSHKWGEPVTLFNGRDLAGWHFDNPAKSSSWNVEGGCLVNQTAGSNIATDRKFRDFKLHVEVNCPSNANSGIYLRGRYEVQIEDDSVEEPPDHRMGAIYGFLAPEPEQPRRPGSWQSFDITLVGRFVTVVQNGQTIISNREIPGITGGAFDSHEELPGPIYLQGDHGGISYRKIILTPANP
jgi:Domain of Unknown Function (DUF1080)